MGGTGVAFATWVSRYYPFRGKPFVISTEAKRSGEICGFFSGSHKTEYGQLGRIAGLNFEFLGHYPFRGKPFVISTEAKRSGEICGFFSGSHKTEYGQLGRIAGLNFEWVAQVSLLRPGFLGTIRFEEKPFVILTEAKRSGEICGTYGQLGRIAGLNFEWGGTGLAFETCVSRYYPFRGKTLCHLDRSEAQWRDLRFFSGSHKTKYGQLGRIAAPCRNLGTIRFEEKPFVISTEAKRSGEICGSFSGSHKTESGQVGRIAGLNFEWVAQVSLLRPSVATVRKHFHEKTPPPFVISTEAKRSGEIYGFFSGSHKTEYGQLGRIVGLNFEFLGHYPFRGKPFVISTEAKRSGEIYGFFSGSHKTEYGQLGRIVGLNFEFLGHYPFRGKPFVISTEAKRSGEICGFFSGSHKTEYGQLGRIAGLNFEWVAQVSLLRPGFLGTIRFEEKPFVILTEAKRSGEICGSFSGSHKTKYGQLGRIAAPCRNLGTIRFEEKPFVISTEAKRSGEICGSFSGSHKTESGQVGRIAGLNFEWVAQVSLLRPGFLGTIRFEEKPFVISTEAKRSGEIYGFFSGSHKTEYGQLGRIVGLNFEFLGHYPFRGKPFVISTEAKRSGEICGFFSGSHKTESGQLGRIAGLNFEWVAQVSLLRPGFLGTIRFEEKPFVILTEAKRSGEICGTYGQLGRIAGLYFEWVAQVSLLRPAFLGTIRFEEKTLCHLDRSEAQWRDLRFFSGSHKTEYGQLGRIAGLNFEWVAQVSLLRSGFLGTIRFRGKTLCHLDRSEAQWRDLRFFRSFSGSRKTKYGQLGRIAGLNFEWVAQVSLLRPGFLGTIRFRGKTLCHLDRSEAQWRDLRFFQRFSQNQIRATRPDRGAKL